MSEAKRQRLQKEALLRWQRQPHPAEQKVGLSQDVVNKIAGMPHVRAVKPLVWFGARLSLDGKKKGIVALSVAPQDKELQKRLVAGQMFSATADRDILVSEYILYQLGITDDDQVEQLLGKPLRLEVPFEGHGQQLDTLLTLLQVTAKGLTQQEEKALQQIAGQLPAILTQPEVVKQLKLGPAEAALLTKLAAQQAKPKPPPLVVTEQLTLRGVLASGEDPERRMPWFWAYRDVDAALPQGTAEEIYTKYPPNQKFGFERLMVEVDDPNHVKEVDEQIRALGLKTFNLLEFLEREQFLYLLIFVGMTVVALIALLVAALGIINTMLMSVLERVREIGIMKAVGARELHLRLMFLLEGALVGLIGGLLGLVLGWAVSLPADAWLRSLVESRLNMKLDRSLFAFPPWLVAGVPLFACLTTTLAAYYPARRAARIDPVHALRHE
jgi:putative ABC transport system permease protein